MTSRAEQPSQDEADAWWKEPGEGYWRALLDQGEVVPEPAPPADPQQVLHSVLTDLEAETAPGASSGLCAEPPVDEWEVARNALQEHMPLCLPVTGANRGGLVVEWNGIQGFVPASHLREAVHAHALADRSSALSRRIGETLTLCLIEVDEEQHRLVFSERAAMPSASSSAAVLGSLQPGTICRGRVLNLTSFGAFVDLGGVEGLIHVSEISWDRVGHPSDLLRPGDEVQVLVVGVNPREGRVALSLKRLRPDPWTNADSRYHVGQTIEGTVTSVAGFGVFVRLEEGLEGLIHVSELPGSSAVNMGNGIHEGHRVQVRVLAIDAQKHRLALSLRQARDAEPANRQEA